MSEREREGIGLSFQKTESRDSIRCNAKLCVSACLCLYGKQKCFLSERLVVVTLIANLLEAS